MINIPNCMQPKKKNHITITKTWKTKTSKQNPATQTNNNNNNNKQRKEIQTYFEARRNPLLFMFHMKEKILI
jgi:hypothetical protein